MKDMKRLSSFSPDYEVMELLLRAYKATLEDYNEQSMVYDDVGNMYISVEDVVSIINQMRDAEEMII